MAVNEISSKSTFIESLSKKLYFKDNSHSLKYIQDFVGHFFESKVFEEIHNLSSEVLEEIISRLWAFFIQRHSEEAKIEVYKIQLNPATSGSRIILNILNDNMPFLVDSLIGFLNRIGLHAHILMRPSFRVKRDSEGILKEIFPSDQAEAGLETVIHCQITGPVSDDIVSVLKKELPDIQKDIALATRDWAAMRLKIHEITDAFQATGQALSVEQVAEYKDFLSWLNNDYFTFLGYRDYHFKIGEKGIIDQEIKSSNLGILRDSRNREIGCLYQALSSSYELKDYILRSEPILITKTTQISPVHRAVPMDVISIKTFDENKNITGIRQFIGLFTSIAYNSSTRDIPLLRRKVSRVIERSGFSPSWHEGRALTHIMDSLPRDELFQASEEELLHIGLKLLSIQELPQLAFFIRPDYFKRFFSCLIYIPRDRFKYELIDHIGKILQAELGCSISLGSAQYGDLAFACLHYMANTSSRPFVSHCNLEDIEDKLNYASRSWQDGLNSELNRQFGEWEGAKLYRKYRDAFSKGYQERFEEAEAVGDISYIEKAYERDQVYARMYRPLDTPLERLRLKLYFRGEVIPLSDIVPTLEHMDLKVEGEFSSKVRAAGENTPLWVYDFEVTGRGGSPIAIEEIEEKFITLFSHVWRKDIDNDGFNRLVIRAALDWRQCMILRAYAKYLHQIHIPFSQVYMEETLLKNHPVTRLLIQLFMERFNPQNPERDQRNIQEISNKIFGHLEAVENPDEDRILRGFMNLITSTVRTNYFQHQKEENKFPPYLSFKFDCKAIEELPAPSPLYEIFVYSLRFEATHLRGGKVARGGIRWSDRKEDFRTEILGLLKAQMVKNAIIVPTGSKGGFVVKTLTDSMTAQEILAEGIACYKLMIRALLELTDNLYEGDIVKPLKTITYDHNDPYLVVAADKGTATFSDFANKIAQSLNFWLDDAFASGGSVGYDHKAIGITARGAWESVKSHFWERGIDIENCAIKVAGIGDMSGDVFGNGMLQSSNIKLVAAFNHKHIFIDPNPHPFESYAERERLFREKLGWEAYNPDLISSGGGVFRRQAKSVKVSPEMKHLLSLNMSHVTPNELIQAILKAPVDLLWFGGIGTFVKSRLETHADVGDRSNDSVRINANMLRCKVIAEGANLSITQRARIDFARSGGHINTDSIDNSGGVDCSDHEVNIKILLRQAIMKQKLSFKDRNLLLKDMTDEVASLVLRNNYAQNLCLRLLRAQGAQLLDSQIKLLRYLEKKGRLDRTFEYLPDEAELAEYQVSRTPLSRPHLAILLPYAKNDLYELILDSRLCDEALLAQEAIDYFPHPLQKSYVGFIATHPLRRELIATMMANKIINRMGPSFIHELMEKTGKPIEDIIRAYFMVQELFKIEGLWQSIEKTEKSINCTSQIQAFQELLHLIRRASSWFLKHFPTPLEVKPIIALFEKGIHELSANFETCFNNSMLKYIEKKMSYYKKLGFTSEFAKQIVKVDLIASSTDIILIAEQTKVFVPHVADLYFAIGSRFKFNFLQKLAANLKSNNSWQRMAIKALMEDLQASQSSLTAKILKYGLSQNLRKTIKGSVIIQRWIKVNRQHVDAFDQLVAESEATVIPDLALLTVLQRKLHGLSN